MKKYIVLGAIALIASLAGASSVQALTGSVGVDVKVSANATSSSKSATSTKPVQKAATSTGSAVSTYVQGLLDSENREGGIGSQVRVIAKEQNDSEASTSAAMTKVESRSSFKTFLIGTDYKNIGALRSELVKTKSRLEKLQGLLSTETDAQAKVELEAEIKSLTESQTKLETFIKTNESKFSLFGWLVRAFSK
jgi:hypothetical protein